MQKNLLTLVPGGHDFESRQVLDFYQWLTVELAPTIQGCKPSTVLSMVDTRGRALLTMWRRYGVDFFRCARVRYMVFHKSPDRETVLFYRPDSLENCLKQQNHIGFFLSLGYPVAQGLDACLNLLRRRFQQACPHEIGLILGIPLKDVLGFMGLSDLPLTCRKEWCIYGNPDESMRIMECFAQNRSIVEKHLASGITCHEIIGGELELRSEPASA